MSVADPEQDETAEVAWLRARVTELEGRLIEVEDWANRTIAAYQERVYWLDRWHLDLNALMARRGAAEVRTAIRTVRTMYRWLVRITRRHTKPKVSASA